MNAPVLATHPTRPWIKTAWTEERIERLKTLQNEGLSCAQISVELGGVTRNGVIGKLSRMGLGAGPKSRGEPRAPRLRLRRLTAYTAAERVQQRRMRQAEIETIGVPELPPDQSDVAVGLLELTDHTCRWPINDAQYCGAEPREDYPYCHRHCRLAYQPLDRRAAVRSWPA